MIRIGSIAPDVRILLDSGARFQLQDLLAKQPLVLMFFPNAQSIDVQRDGYEFIQHLQEAASLGAYLLAVSPNDLTGFKDFLKLYDVPLSMARDESLEVCRNYRVVWLKGSAIRRATFVIDTGGIIRASVHHELLMQKHWATITRALRDLRDGRNPQPHHMEAK
jgi:peroxiredoxin